MTGRPQKPLRRVLAFDERVLLGVRRWHGPRVTRLMRTFTRMGDPSTWTLVSASLLAAGGASVNYGWRVAAGSLIATAIAGVVKRIARRDRPSVRITGFTALAENPDAYSFPSGHTAAAFGVAVALAGQGHWLGALTLCLATAIAASRVYLGAHYPLDVAIGASIGALSGVVARFIV